MSFLRQSWLVYTREVASLLTKPLFFVLTGIFFSLSALVYLALLIAFARGDSTMTVNVTDSVVLDTFNSVHFFLIFMVPLLTMRVFAEDRASGMLDLLQTTPAKDWALVVGKFAGTLAGIFVYIALTFSFPLVTSMVGEVEWPVIIGSMIALVLIGGGYISIGLFFSAITESQVVAAVLSYVTIFGLFFARFFSDSFQILSIQQAIRHFSVGEHVSAILSGNIAPMNVVYFLCMTAIFLFLTARILEMRRWGS